MPDEPDNLAPVVLRNVRANLDEHSTHFEHIEAQLTDIEKQLDEYKKIVRYSLGQSAETEPRQARQESRIDEVFEKLEKLLSDKISGVRR